MCLVESMYLLPHLKSASRPLNNRACKEVCKVFSTLLVLFAGAEDENVLIIILQYVVTGLWIGQWDKIGIVMAIILILILLFFIGKELRSIRKEGDLQDEEKKNI